MKTSFTLFFCFSISLMMAQPTLTSSWAPNIGDMVQDVVGANAINLEPGDNGANASWDYSAVMPDNNVPVGNFEYADPSVSSFANLFPEATIAVVVSGIDPNTLPTTFYKASNDKMELLGNALPTVNFSYDDPQKLAQFPFSYGDSFEDDFAATNDIIGIMSFVSGHMTVTADAYGTIKTPKGTFDDVIRIKTETTRRDSTPIAPGSESIVTLNTINYSWYKNTIGNNIASLTIESGENITIAAGQTIVTEIEETRAFSWNNLTTSSTFEKINGTLPFEINSIGPNPVVNDFKINLKSECNCNIEVKIISTFGQIIKRDQFDLYQGDNDLIIEAADFPAGNYFVKLIHENGYGVFQINKIN